MSELIPVNIVIADRSYRIRTKPEDEEVIRRTVKLINEKIVEFKTQFAGKDMQDYVAMVIIWYATQAAAAPGAVEAPDEALKLLARLETQIDKALQIEP